MKPLIDIIECQRDSPQFRLILSENEKDLEVLESKLEKVIKNCSQMVTIGKTFNLEQEQLVHSLWEISSYFSEDSAVQGSLNCMLDALKEAVNFQKILIDQAARAIIKNFTHFLREDVTRLNEKRHTFEKASSELDNCLHKSSNATRTSDCEDLNKQVWATRQAFRHTAIDYMYGVSEIQAKKRHEVVDAILSYIKAYNTFYHQGSELYDDLKPSLDKISVEVQGMRDEVSDLHSSMENRHVGVTGRALVPNHRDSSVYSSNSCSSIQGYLFKRANNAFKSWNRRYFTLQNNQLVYRKRSGEEITVMEDDLRLCSVKPAVDVERRFCFEVTSNIKSHVLQAESEESCRVWIDALISAISSAIHEETPQNESFGHLGSAQSPPSLQQMPDVTSSKPFSDIENSKSRLKEIMQLPGNDVCCDCGSPDPKWASINLGITLCIECSGIHRSLGVHYSKVRSLTLDYWEPEVLPVMEALGNDIVNHIYLSSVTSSGPVESSVTSSGLVGNSMISDVPVGSSITSSGSMGSTMSPNVPVGSSMSSSGSTMSSSGPVGSSIRPSGSQSDLDRSNLQTNHHRLNEIGMAYPNCERLVRETWIKKKYLEKRFVSPISNEAAFSKIVNHSKKVPRQVSGGLLSTGQHQEGDQNFFRETNCENALRMESLTPNDLLMTSSGLGHLPLMALALALGADKNYHNHEGKTPLHLSASSNCAVAVEFLLLNGVQVNSADCRGQTALHIAAIQANIIQVYRLIKYRADFKIEDCEGNTAVDYAVQSSEPDLVTLLRIATLSEQLDKEQVEEDMMTIMHDLYRRKCSLLK